MAHHHDYGRIPSFDPHFLICANKRFRCDAPQIRDILYNCGACPWCLAHPQTMKKK